MNATNCSATGPPAMATIMASTAATATNPRTSVSVSVSKPAHSAATITQTTHAAIPRS